MGTSISHAMKDWISVKTCFLAETPPFWKDTQVKDLFTGLDLPNVVVKKMRWSVGTLWTST